MNQLVICRTDEVEGGEFASRIVVDNKAYAVYKLGNEYFVSSDECTHGPGSLGEGTIVGEEIECPFHQGRFFIRTGQPSFPPCTEPIRVWPGHIEDDQIWIDLDEKPPHR
ncbi:MAG TPA: non-heme iron oxygenase ferredoxin subunit [Stellaceae bacterium]|jgi:nitrite reductase/ring-hydroxylating ferredoxin subunit